MTFFRQMFFLLIWSVSWTILVVTKKGTRADRGMRILIFINLYEELFMWDIITEHFIASCFDGSILGTVLLECRLPKVTEAISFICGGYVHRLVISLVLWPDQSENGHANEEINNWGRTIVYQRADEVSRCQLVRVIIQAETLSSQCLNNWPCRIKKDQNNNPDHMLIKKINCKNDLTIVLLQRHLTILSSIALLFALRKWKYILRNMEIIAKSISIMDICTTLHIIKIKNKLTY